MHRHYLSLLLMLLMAMSPSVAHAQAADAPSSAENAAPSPEPSISPDGEETGASGEATLESDDENGEGDEGEDDRDFYGTTPPASSSDTEAGGSFVPPLTALFHTPVDISGGFAVNPFFMPAIQTKFGVRFPWEVFNWGLTAGYSYGPIHMLFPGQEPLPQQVSLGFQWYVLDLGFAQLYADLTGGYLFQAPHRGDGVNVPLGGVPTVMAGAGLAIGTPVALGWLPPSALNISLDVGYPFIIRPEFSLRVTI